MQWQLDDDDEATSIDPVTGESTKFFTAAFSHKGRKLVGRPQRNNSLFQNCYCGKGSRCGTIPHMPTPCQSPIEAANAADTPRLARLLAESLFDDPLQRWLFPDERGRLAASETMFRRLLKPKIAAGLVRIIRDTEAEIASAAVWTPPHPPAPSRGEHYSESLFLRWAYGQRIHEVRRGFTALANRHPREPYWYLQALATTPEQRGQGHAARLLQAQMDACSATNELIALETSQSANVAYYQKFGFQVADELMLEPGLPVWLLCHSAPKQSM